MKNILFLFVFLITGIPYATAQPITFQKTIGGSGNEEAYSVQQTTDGGYILAGYSTSFGPGNFENAYLVKTDSLGDVSWAKTFGVAGGASKFRSARQTPDGGYIAAGWIYQPTANGYDVLLVKTDAGGNELWSKRYGGSGADSAHSIEFDLDGNLIIAGSSPGQGFDQASLIKLTPTGAMIWHKTYGSAVPLLAEAGKAATEGGYYFIQSYVGFQGLSLVKVHSDGSLHWMKGYSSQVLWGSPHHGVAQESRSGGFWIATRGGAAGGNDVSIVRSDEQGDIIWNKYYGNTADDIGSVIFEAEDGSIIVAGATTSSGLGDKDLYVFKIDSTGGLIWSRGYGESGEEHAYAMSGTTDGGLVLAGGTTSFGNGRQIYLLKTDSTGASGCNARNAITMVNPGINVVMTSPITVLILNTEDTATLAKINVSESDSTLCSSITHTEVLAFSEEVKVYPNPASHTLNIEHQGGGTLQLTDMLGRALLEQALSNTSSTHTINIAHLPAGVYLYRITGRNRQLTGKVMVSK